MAHLLSGGSARKRASQSSDLDFVNRRCGLGRFCLRMGAAGSAGLAGSDSPLIGAGGGVLSAVGATVNGTNRAPHLMQKTFSTVFGVPHIGQTKPDCCTKRAPQSLQNLLPSRFWFRNESTESFDLFAVWTIQSDEQAQRGGNRAERDAEQNAAHACGAGHVQDPFARICQDTQERRLSQKDDERGEQHPGRFELRARSARYAAVARKKATSAKNAPCSGVYRLSKIHVIGTLGNIEPQADGKDERGGDDDDDAVARARFVPADDARQMHLEQIDQAEQQRERRQDDRPLLERFTHWSSKGRVKK